MKRIDATHLCKPAQAWTLALLRGTNFYDLVRLEKECADRLGVSADFTFDSGIYESEADADKVMAAMVEQRPDLNGSIFVVAG